MRESSSILNNSYNTEASQQLHWK